METVKQEALIRERAYAIWEDEGCPEGRALEHWERAYHEVFARIGVIDTPAVSQPKKRKTVKSRIRTALKSAISA